MVLAGGDIFELALLLEQVDLVSFADSALLHLLPNDRLKIILLQLCFSLSFGLHFGEDIQLSCLGFVMHWFGVFGVGDSPGQNGAHVIFVPLCPFSLSSDGSDVLGLVQPFALLLLI